MKKAEDAIKPLRDDVLALKLAAEAGWKQYEKATKDIVERVDRLMEIYANQIVAPMPSVKDRGEEMQDAPTMDDEAFARLRKNANSGQDLVKRMGALSALLVTIRNAVIEKRQRLAALDSRVANGEAGEAEVAVARSRKKFIEDGLIVLMKRLWAVTEDFAKTRKTLMSRIVMLSNEVSVTLPKNSDMVKSCFSGVNADIESSMRLINEIEGNLKAGEKRLPATAFGGRSK